MTPQKEYNVADPMTNRAVNKPYRSDQDSDRGPVLSSRYTRRLAGAQASDGPVDVWVDDVDTDWDDIVVPEHLPADLGPPAATSARTPQESPDSTPTRIVPGEAPETGAPTAETPAP